MSNLRRVLTGLWDLFGMRATDFIWSVTLRVIMGKDGAPDFWVTDASIGLEMNWVSDRTQIACPIQTVLSGEAYRVCLLFSVVAVSTLSTSQHRLLLRRTEIHSASVPRIPLHRALCFFQYLWIRMFSFLYLGK